MVNEWLSDRLTPAEHSPAVAFEPVRRQYDARLATFPGGENQREIHRALLSNLTNLLLGVDITGHLGRRLSGELLNDGGGFRSAQSQGAAKNNGENFVNAIVYALSDLLAGQDEILIDKGVPPRLKDALHLKRTVRLAGGEEILQIPIECDFAIYQRSNPLNAIVISAKTRLKEVFHVGTMWKLFFDMTGDDYCKAKWSLSSTAEVSEILYCFATADMVPPGGAATQGPDVERPSPRNLIKMDASFFDYVFVSKPAIGHVSSRLDLSRGREALFHELGCLIDLIEQKFGISL